MAQSVDQKLLKSTKFPPEFNQKVDMTKVNMPIIKMWIASKISEILGFEDDVVTATCHNVLEASQYPKIKELQIMLSGFLSGREKSFCKELWNLCLSAQISDQGVPKELIEAKKEDIMKEKMEAEKAQEKARRQREQERIKEQDFDQLRQRERAERGRTSGRSGNRGAGYVGGSRDLGPRQPARRDSPTPPPTHRGDRREPQGYRRRSPPRTRSPFRAGRRSRSRSRSPDRHRRSRAESPPRARSPRYRRNGGSRSPRRHGNRSPPSPRSVTPPRRSSYRSRDRRRARSPSKSRHSSSPSPSGVGRGGRVTKHDDRLVSEQPHADVRKDNTRRDRQRHAQDRSRSPSPRPTHNKRRRSIERYQPQTKQRQNSSSTEPYVTDKGESKRAREELTIPSPSSYTPQLAGESIPMMKMSPQPNLATPAPTPHQISSQPVSPTPVPTLHQVGSQPGSPTPARRSSQVDPGLQAKIDAARQNAIQRRRERERASQTYKNKAPDGN